MARRHVSRSLRSTRRRRRRDPVKFRLFTPKWQDPYPEVAGTLPEKIIFAELRLSGIYFIFQGDFPKEDRYVQVSADDPGFKPDFILPEWKVILDPFGDYHHSKDFAGEEALNKLTLSDSRKLMFYEKKGYEFVHPWSSEVLKYGGGWVLQQSKRLQGPPLFPLNPEESRFKAMQGWHPGEHIGLGSTGVGAANTARAKRRGTKTLLLRPSR